MFQDKVFFYCMMALGAALIGLYYMGIIDDSLIAIVAGLWAELVGAINQLIS
jgi:hypothetical protein